MNSKSEQLMRIRIDTTLRSNYVSDKKRLKKAVAKPLILKYMILLSKNETAASGINLFRKRLQNR